tara:strand:- start:794 stop:997 length:204 start_codon:yes stop_codon:yes gene_type:complete
MIITINGETTDKYFDRLNIESLLKQLDLSSSQTIVELNKVALKKKDYSETFITDGDIIEIVQIAAGG